MQKMYIFVMGNFCKILTIKMTILAIILFTSTIGDVYSSEKNSGSLHYGSKVQMKDPRVNMYDGNNITGNLEVKILPFDMHKTMPEKELMRKALLSSRTMAGGPRGIDIPEKSLVDANQHILGVSHMPFVISKENMRQTVYSSKTMARRWVKS